MRDLTEERGEIAHRLRAARKQAGLSQGQVATLLGLHRPAVSEIEAGRRAVAAEELRQFADAYGVDVDWLLGRRAEGVSPEVELAARELGKLNDDDLASVMALLGRIRLERRK